MTTDRDTKEINASLILEEESERKISILPRYDASRTGNERMGERFSVIQTPPSPPKDAAEKEEEEKEADEQTRKAFGSLKNKKADKKTDASKAQKQDVKGKPSTKKAMTSTAKLGKGAKPKKADATEQYRRDYVKRQRALEDERLGKNLTPEQRNALIAAEKKIEKEETSKRVMAKEFFNQIIWWKQQYGMGTYTDQYINGIIYDLQSQLGAIDARYWP